MKNLVLKSSIAALAFMAMGAANAQSVGQVNFTGNIRHNTCSLKSDSLNQTVAFGTISPTQFTGIGSVAGNKAFKINLEGCTLGAVPGAPPGTNYPRQAHVKFFGPNVDSNTGRLRLVGASSATGIQVRIKNANGLEMPLNQDTPTTQLSTLITLVQGENSLDFSAEYIATAATVGGGAANTNVEFEVAYL